jgi:L-iditol 2-dehydrogenase
MKVIAVVDERKTKVFEIDMPVPNKNEVLIRIKGCSLCTFEQRVFTRQIKYPLPWVGGHEIAGVIEALGEGVDPAVYTIGAKVAPRLLNVCGNCYYCRHGMESLCIEAYKFETQVGKLYPGGLGEYIIANVSQIYFLDDRLSFEEAVFAEPLGCVLSSIERAKIGLGDDVVIIGGGVMGMLHILCSKLSGARVILSEPDNKRAEFAKKLGADFTINPKEQDPVQFVKDLSGGRGAEVVINTTPISALVEQGIKMTAPLGRFVQYSSMHPDTPVSISPNWLHNSYADLTGTVNTSIRTFNSSVTLLNKGLINVKPLMSEVYDILEVDKAFERSLCPETFRVMIRF